jgi:hypothetical protein
VIAKQRESTLSSAHVCTTDPDLVEVAPGSWHRFDRVDPYRWDHTVVESPGRDIESGEEFAGDDLDDDAD